MKTTRHRPSSVSPAHAAPSRKSAAAPPAKGPAQAWTPKASHRGSTAKHQSTALAKAQAASVAAPHKTMAPAPADVVRAVKAGDVTLKVPMRPMDLGPFGMVHIKPGTQLVVTARAADGKLDPDKVALSFSPPIDGPLGVALEGARMTKDGRIQVNIDNFPDLTIGSPLPLELSKLADMLETKPAAPQGAGAAPKAAESPSLGSSVMSAVRESVIGNDPGKLLNAMFDLKGSSLSVKNAELRQETLRLGNSGSIHFAPGNKFTVEGRLDDFRVKGHANLEKIAIDTDGVKLDGAAGTGDFALHFVRDAKGKPHVDTRVDNLSIATRYAIAKRANGDFVSLANGRLEGGSIHLSEFPSQANGSPIPRGLDSLTIKKFSGVLEKARLTIPDGTGTAQVDVSRSTVSGDLHVTPNGIVLHGTLDGQATVRDYQGTFGAARVDVDSANVKAKGHVDFDSNKGFAVSGGSVAVNATLNGGSVETQVPIIGKARVGVGKGSNLDVAANGIDFSGDRGLEALGSVKGGIEVQGGQVDVGFVHLRDQHLKLSGDTAKLFGATLKAPAPPPASAPARRTATSPARPKAR